MGVERERNKRRKEKKARVIICHICCDSAGDIFLIIYPFSTGRAPKIYLKKSGERCERNKKCEIRTFIYKRTTFLSRSVTCTARIAQFAFIKVVQLIIS